MMIPDILWKPVAAEIDQKSLFFPTIIKKKTLISTWTQQDVAFTSGYLNSELSVSTWRHRALWLAAGQGQTEFSATRSLSL